MVALKKQVENYKKITILFAYGLFAFLLLATTISTALPFGSLLFDPHARQLNVAVIMTSLIAGSILPPVVSYVMGDKTTRSKASIDHHFNGVLFGIASYWLSLFFSFIGADTISGIRASFSEPLATIIAGWPIIATLAILVLVAIGFTKTTKKVALVIDYRPFRITLFLGFVAAFVYILWNQQYVANSPWTTSALYVFAPVLLVSTAYLLLSNIGFSTASHLTRALAAVSFGFIASSIAGRLIPGITMGISIGIGLLCLTLYLIVVRYAK